MLLRADGGSFKDPAGRVYRIDPGTPDERVVRALNQPAADLLERLRAEPFFAELVAGGRVVAAEPVDPKSEAGQAVASAGWDAAVEHDVVEFVTWPYEWPFSMLRDAALLHLQVLKAAAAAGWMLKDATSYNIQWNGARPVFIDVCSFEPWEEGEHWRGYRQFCATHLTPLMLTSHLGIAYQPLLRSDLEGIMPEQASRHFYGRKRFKRGVLSHIWFPAKAERRVRKPPGPERKQRKTMVLALLDSMERLVAKLKAPRARSDWSAYAGTHSYEDAELELKKDFVTRHSAARRPRLTWDLGANTGVFACVAAAHSGTVVAVDSDPDAVDLLYRKLRSEGPGNVIPLVMDLANLSPSQGWAGAERPAFDQRRSPDLVLCLALVHHMRVAANVPLPLFIGWLRTLEATVICEFVGRDDEMFHKLLENKKEDYPDYTLESFEAEVRKHFTIEDRLDFKDGLRELFLLEPAP